MKRRRENNNSSKKVSIVVDITEISAIVAAAGLLVGVVYYVLDMRHQSKVRETDVIIRMNPSFSLSLIEWQEASFKVANLQFKDYDDFVKKYGSISTETPTIMAIHTVANFYEGIGFLLKRNLVGIDYVWDCYGPSVVLVWEKLKPVIEGSRKQYNIPTAYEPFEFLYDEMKKREQTGVKNG
jgi:hypothetical protein